VLLADGRRTTLTAGAGRTCAVAHRLAHGVADVARAHADEIRFALPED
jgi:hypothetical protein